MSQILVPGVEFCQEGVVGLGHGGQIAGFCPRRLSCMLSLTAARARSAQGASQFAAGYAAVRVTHHSDGRPVHIMKTS